MKNLKLTCLLFATAFLLSISSCEEVDCCVYPAAAEINGTWEFIRVNYGFTNTTQTAAEVGYTERLEIDGTNSRVRRYRDGKEVENTPFTISEQGNSKIITFENTKEYSNYTIFTEGEKTMLSLYERSPVGAILADGGVYYYEKK
ncbi:MAG: hypothetical protein NWP83_11620 [Spirosomaceae bacterium]|nr:hypothetical protein [Spirosomataceae bacterium]